MEFDFNGPAMANSGIFGLPWTAAEAELLLVPVPWAATVSYGTGAEKGPEALLEASKQVDLFLEWLPEVWRCKTAMLPIDASLMEKQHQTRHLAEALIRQQLEQGAEAMNPQLLNEVNTACAFMNQTVESICGNLLKQGKTIGLVGGDHSSPLGYYKALAEFHPQFSVLQIDAHADLRKAYEGFRWSHASIMYNAMEDVPAIEKLVQIGIRDLCQEEADYAKAHPKIDMHTDAAMQYHLLEGGRFSDLVGNWISALGPKVYLSIDIDGLDPSLCPNTGTPVPGGFQFFQLSLLLQMLVKSGKQIIGFDLVEVVPGTTSWDANVGARLLFQLCASVHATKK